MGGAEMEVAREVRVAGEAGQAGLEVSETLHGRGGAQYLSWADTCATSGVGKPGTCSHSASKECAFHALSHACVSCCRGRSGQRGPCSQEMMSRCCFPQSDQGEQLLRQP